MLRRLHVYTRRGRGRGVCATITVGTTTVSRIGGLVLHIVNSAVIRLNVRTNKHCLKVARCLYFNHFHFPIQFPRVFLPRGDSEALIILPSTSAFQQPVPCPVAYLPSSVLPSFEGVARLHLSVNPNISGRPASFLPLCLSTYKVSLAQEHQTT